VQPVADWSDFPGGYQCIVGVRHFIENHWGLSFPAMGGHAAKDGCAELGACMTWVYNLPDDAVWNRHPWGSVDPQPYDILIFPPTAKNAYGHAAAFDHFDGGGTLFIMDDNWDGSESKSCAWAGHEGWVHSVTGYDPYGFYRLKTLEPPPPDQAPKGAFDAAACDVGLTGWAQDPDEPGAAISIHLTFGGDAGSGAPSLDVTADVKRDDLCQSLGSCEHGFSLPVPIGVRDGQAHDVYAYAVGTKDGGPTTLLGGGPKSIACAPPEAPFSPAIRRHVADPTSLDAWRLSTLTDVARFTDAMTTAIPAGDDAPAAPALVKGDDGAPAVWLVDGGERRLVPSDAAMTAWHLDPASVVTKPAAEIAAMPEGRAWPSAAFSFMAPDGAVYLLDTPLPTAPGAGGGGGGGAHPGGPIGAGGGDATGAGGGDVGASVSDAPGGSSNDEVVGSCSASPRPASPSTLAFAAAALALAAARRRRR
jgi:MYXO-CTERM domain-containing protein